MASDGHDERLRGALAVAPGCVFNLRETAPSQDLIGQVGSDYGRARGHTYIHTYMETSEEEESEDGDDPRVEGTLQVHL